MGVSTRTSRLRSRATEGFYKVSAGDVLLRYKVASGVICGGALHHPLSLEICYSIKANFY